MGSFLQDDVLGQMDAFAGSGNRFKTDGILVTFQVACSPRLLTLWAEINKDKN